MEISPDFFFFWQNTGCKIIYTLIPTWIPTETSSGENNSSESLPVMFNNMGGTQRGMAFQAF